MVRPKNRFFWRVFLAQVLLLALVLTVCLGLVLSEQKRTAREHLERWLEAQARVAAESWPTVASLSGNRDAADAQARQLAAAAGPWVRLTFIAPDGTVLADSATNAARDNHADRPEVSEALTSGSARVARWSHTMSQYWYYVALRVGPAQEPVGVARASLPQQAFDTSSSLSARRTTRIFLLAFAASTLLALGFSRLLSVPLRRLVRLARRQSPAPSAERVTAENDELETLADSLNHLREELAAKQALVDYQHGTLELLMEQLRDGVVVADARGRIVLINPAAVQLLDLSGGHAGSGERFHGKPIESCIPLLELQGMLRTSDVGDGFTDEESAHTADRRVELRRRGGSVVLLARSSPIRLLGPSPLTASVPAQAISTDLSARGRAPADTAREGRLLILTDITELARTVQVRSDFVANASHELRTPLAAIRMASEMLRSPETQADAEDFRRCLNVIDRHTTWLEELLRDLLDLSKLESPTARFQPRTIAVERFISELSERFALTIERKRLQFEVDGGRGPKQIVANPSLLRMVLDNLVDNALKFTPEGGKVSVSWSSSGSHVTFEVADTGCGIPIEDQARVFERFYQVERGRSEGEDDRPRGTGLGLSIVRHAVVAMRGQIELQSVLGRGTRITVTLPTAGRGGEPAGVAEAAADVNPSSDAT